MYKTLDGKNLPSDYQSFKDKKSNLVFILWGSYAQSKKILIDSSKHLIIATPHPSPLSAHRGFLDQNLF